MNARKAKTGIATVIRSCLPVVLVVVGAAPAGAASNAAVQRLLALSFACPSGTYKPDEQTFGSYAEFLDRYHWVGDDKTFRLAIDQKQMVGSLADGLSVSDSRELIEARIGDIEVSVRNGTDVVIRCKEGAQPGLCIVNLPTQPGEKIAEDSGDAERSFHACSTEAADDIRIALEHLMGYRH